MRFKHHLPNLLILTASLVAAGLAAELGLRLYARTDGPIARRLASWDPYKVLVEPHGRFGYRQKPNSTFRYDSGTFALSNGMGFRGPMVPVPKNPDTYRIILLGGSTTHGWRVSDDETIDAHMRVILSERYPTSRFEVVNLAFDAYDSYQLLERLRSDGFRLEPDLIIVNSGVNDVRNARYQNLQDGDPRLLPWENVLARLRKEQQLGRPTPWSQLKHYSYLARLPGLVKQITRVREARSSVRKESYYPDAADYFERNLRSIAAEAEKMCVPIIFSTPPSSLRSKYEPDDVRPVSYWLENAEITQAYRDSLSGRMQELVGELRLAGKNVELVNRDLAPDMFIDDAHLTSTGNRALALTFASAASSFVNEHGPPDALCDSDTYPRQADVSESIPAGT